MKLLQSLLVLAIFWVNSWIQSKSIVYFIQDLIASNNIKKEVENLSNMFDTNDSILKKLEKKPVGSEISSLTVNFIQKPKKGKKSKKGKRSKKKGYKIIELENYDLIDDPRKLAKYVTYSKCVRKSGYLTYIQKRPTKKNREITVVPIFVSLNKHTLSLFKSFKPTSLFQVVNLDLIQRVTLGYKNTLCFDIIINNYHKKQFTSGPLTLCAKDIKEMKNWINAILEFKECKIKVKNNDHNGKILVDFNKMNKLIKRKGAFNMFDLASIQYDANDKAFKMTKAQMAQKIMMKRKMLKILEMIKESKIAKNQMKRKYRGKMKSARGLQMKIFTNEEVMKNLQVKKNIVAAENEFALKKKLHKKKELMILERIQKKILRLKKRELHDYKRTWKTQLKMEKQNANKETKTMMNIIMQNQKLGKYAKCYSVMLKGFTNTVYINHLCVDYYGEWGVASCSKKENFCNMCCDFHIGNNYPDKRFTCKRKCNRNIKGKPIKRDEVKQKSSKKKGNPQSKKASHKKK